MDRLFAEARSVLMAQIRGRDNKRTETKIVGLLKKSHITGWRRHVAIKFRKEGLRFGVASDGTVFKKSVRPDFAFPKQMVALFVDGCFWHGCPKCGRLPKSQANFWSAKILRNKERDRFQVHALRQIGWRVVRIREHELHCMDSERFARKIKFLLRK